MEQKHLALEQLEAEYHISSLALPPHERAAARQAGVKYLGSSLATLRDDCNNNNKAPAKAVTAAKPTL